MCFWGGATTAGVEASRAVEVEAMIGICVCGCREPNWNDSICELRLGEGGKHQGKCSRDVTR